MNNYVKKRISVLFAVFLLSALAFTAFPQTVSINVSKAPLTKVFELITEQTGYSFAYSRENIDAGAQVTVALNRTDLRAALNQILAPQNLRYEINDGKIYILSRTSAQSTQEPRQQKLVVRGTVLDESGAPIPGANVVIANSQTGTATDQNGAFTLSVSKGDVLRISFMGFEDAQVTIGDQTRLAIRLKEATGSLDEVTVIAYGERSQKDLIGSVSSVKGDDIKEIPSSSLENLLQGRMAGVEITNTSGAPGGGGAIIAIRGYNSMMDQNSLRMGDYGEPLYVIDGIPVQGFTSPITGTNTLSSIDPSTIESIEVLKDAASAAIYGSRAGRGVILITTKRGREGKASFSANVSQTWGFLPTSPDQTGGVEARRYGLLGLKNMRNPYSDPGTNIYRFPQNRYEAFGTYLQGGVYDYFWDRAVKGYYYNPSNPESPIQSFVQDSLNPYYNNSTNWYDYAYRVGTVLNSNFQASGGGEKYNYLIGTGIYDEKGIAYGSNFTRVNFLTNLNVSPVKNFRVDTRFSLTYMKRNRGTGGDGKRGSAEKIERMPVNPLQASPFLPGGGEIEEKMLEIINKQVEKNENYQLRASVTLDYQFLDGFNFRTSGSADMGIEALDLFKPRDFSAIKLNSSTTELARSLQVMNENLLTYKKQFNGVHNIEAIAGFSIETKRRNDIWVQGQGGASDKIHYIYDKFPILPPEDLPTDLQVLQRAFTDLQESALVSTFGRFAYNYKTRYLAEFTLRRDGSSVFGDKNKYATFPAVAAGWAFADEPFMQWAWWMNQGKARLSWGKSGEVFPDPYRAHGLLRPEGSFLGRPIIDVDRHNWGGMINRELKWVIHNQWDAGLDIDLLDRRLRLKLDYYHRTTEGLLSPTSLPKTIYIYDYKVMNANRVINEGVEFEAIADIIRPKTYDALSWRVRFNATHNRNYLLATHDARDIGPGNHIPLHMLGRPLYMVYTFVDGAIYPTDESVPMIYDIRGQKHRLYMANNTYPFGAGMKEIKDLSGDNELDYNDRLYQGSSLPRLSGGVANELKYKNFDLSVLFVYSLGRTMLNMKKWESLDPGKVAGGEPLLADISKLKFWEKPGDENIKGILPMISAFPAANAQFGGAHQSYVEKVNYVKLKTITLGCHLPAEWAKKASLSDVRFFVTGENLFTLTNYSGPDPEVVPFFGSGDTAGTDNYRNYPLARKISLGLTVNF